MSASSASAERALISPPISYRTVATSSPRCTSAQPPCTSLSPLTAVAIAASDEPTHQMLCLSCPTEQASALSGSRGPQPRQNIFEILPWPEHRSTIANFVRFSLSSRCTAPSATGCGGDTEIIRRDAPLDVDCPGCPLGIVDFWNRPHELCS